MAAVCSDRMDTEREFFNHIINELDGVLLTMTRIDFHGPDPCGIINGCVLKASDSIPLKVPESDEFDVDLDVMARDFLGIMASVNSPAC